VDANFKKECGMAEEAIYEAKRKIGRLQRSERKGWGMEMHLHEAKNMTRNASRHTGLLRA